MAGCEGQTGEESIVILQESLRQNKIIQKSPNTFFRSADIADGVKNAERRITALNMAIAALRAEQDTPSNAPLTLEELREMDEKPVWICGPDGSDGMWALVDLEYELCWTAKGGIVKFNTYGKDWTGCLGRPDGGREYFGIRPGGRTMTTKETIKTQWPRCPDCEPENGIWQYCPFCGRPKTEEAWLELVRRMEGEYET